MKIPNVTILGPTPSYELNKSTATVYGTLAESGYAVWVNGIKATDNGPNAWRADNVPLPEGTTAVVQARAIPTSDNGGDGTGGGGGTQSSYADPGNPSSGQAQTVEAPDEDRPAGITLKSDFSNYYSYETRTWLNAPAFPDEVNQGGWSQNVIAGEGGGRVWWSLTEEIWPQEVVRCRQDDVTTWEPNLCSGTIVRTADPVECREPDEPPQGTAAPPHICNQHCSVDSQREKIVLDSPWPEPPGQEQWDRETVETVWTKAAQTRLQLLTGGKAVPKRNNLWVITGGASSIREDWIGDTCGNGVPRTPVPYEQVTIGALGNLGADGKLYVVLPDGVAEDATPKAEGLDQASALQRPATSSDRYRTWH